jgi:hypothetical protein
MPRASVDTLVACVKTANGSKMGIKKCEDRFIADGGKGSTEGGKVFSDPDGGEVYITAGGKVFRAEP